MIDAVNKILQPAGLGTARTASVKIERKTLSSQIEVQTVLKDFGEAEGWLCLTDEVLVVNQAKPLPSLAGRVVLSAELASGEKSIHMRQNADIWEQYSLERYEGGVQVMVEERFLSIPKGEKAMLKYEIFWQTDGTGALFPYAGRFAGFEKGGNG